VSDPADPPGAVNLSARAIPGAAGKVAAAVDPVMLLDDLRTLVHTRSITGSEEAVADLLVEMLSEIQGVAVGLILEDPETIRADPDWPGEEMPRSTLPIVIARLGRPGGRRIVLVGHTDVVPPGDPSAWTVDPWAGEVRDGQLYGRGACDMKGGVAAIVAAVRAVSGAGAVDGLMGEVVVAFVPSEEDGGQGMLAAIRAGVTGDMAVITEPSNLDVVVAHAGAITFRLSVPGRAAHASQRREGISALDKLWVLARALEADEARRNAEESDPLMTALGMPYPTIIGIVRGGDWASTVIDRIVADGRYGVRLGQSPSDAEAELRACIAAACAEDPFLRDHPATVEIVGGRFGSARVPSDHPLPVGLARVAELVTGRHSELLGEPYGADMRLLVNEGRTPTVIFGPGDVRVAHSADERVPLAEVEACARVLATWIVDELA
jgi:acetylornithine deacetylase